MCYLSQLFSEFFFFNVGPMFMLKMRENETNITNTTNLLFLQTFLDHSRYLGKNVCSLRLVKHVQVSLLYIQCPVKSVTCVCNTNPKVTTCLSKKCQWLKYLNSWLANSLVVGTRFYSYFWDGGRGKDLWFRDW